MSMFVWVAILARSRKREKAVIHKNIFYENHAEEKIVCSEFQNVSFDYLQ